MADDARGRGILRRAGDAALHALARVGHRALIGAIGDADALHPHAEARVVHHHEHVLEAAILLADEVADGAAVVAEREHRGRARVDAELVLERHAAHVVARAEAAVRVHQELGHDEQRDALGARRRVGRAREHEVDDVVGVVVLAVGDEDLAAVDLVRCRRPAAPPSCGWRPGPSRPAARSGSSCPSTRRRPSSAGTRA